LPPITSVSDPAPLALFDFDVYPEAGQRNGVGTALNDLDGTSSFAGQVRPSQL